MTAESASGGTQSLQRALAVLRAVADAGEGARLVDVARSCSLNTATAHRLLRTLLEEGLLVGGADKTYSIGPEVLRIAGRAKIGRMAVAQYGDAISKIADETEDTVFLSIRNGMDAICVMARSGRYHIRTMSLEEGSVRPLGIGAGSLALLSVISESERDLITAANAKRYATFGLTAEIVEAMADVSSSRGHAVNDGRILEGVWGVGVPIRSQSGFPGAAISVAAIEARMSEERILGIVSLIEELVGAKA